MLRLSPLALIVLAGCAGSIDLTITGPIDGVVVSAPVDVVVEIDGNPDSLSRLELSIDNAVVATAERDVLFDDDVRLAFDPAGFVGAVPLNVRAIDLFDNEVDKATVVVNVVRAALVGGDEGEGDVAAEGEGEVVAEGEGDVIVGGEEGEGEGAVVPDGWESPPARAFSKLTEFPTNASGNPAAVNPGNLGMYLYVPAGVPHHAPVVVALHGCTQSAQQYKDTTGWTDLADRFKFYVVFPEQSSTANDTAKTGNPMRCFNWAGYYGERMDRGQGENQSIVDMVHVLTGDDVYAADADRVFVTGLSAGAAMTALLLAEWPDVFAAGAPMAGIPFDCARDVNGAMSCMNSGSRGQSPSTWGARARAAQPAGYAGRQPRIQIWQGSSDTTVVPSNQTELMEQFTDLNGADQTVDDDAGLVGVSGAHTRKAYKRDGRVVVETITIPGMQHGISVDPGTGDNQAGSVGGFAFDKDVSSTFAAARFFGLVDGGVVAGEGEGEEGEGEEGEGDSGVDEDCVEFTSTVILHVYAVHPRMAQGGTALAPTYTVIGSGEPVGSDVNPYLDNVTVHSVGAGFALGGCT